MHTVFTATNTRATLPVQPTRYASASEPGRGLALAGTGGVYDLSQAAHWRSFLSGRVPFALVSSAPVVAARGERPDPRTAGQHLVNVRQVLNPAVSDLAAVFGVSRQAVYKWQAGDATPEPEKLDRLRALSRAADELRTAGISHAPALAKIKAFEGRSLLDLAGSGALLPAHVRSLIEEARAMDAARARLGLAQSKAPASDAWRAELSIPGRPEP